MEAHTSSKWCIKDWIRPSSGLRLVWMKRTPLNPVKRWLTLFSEWRTESSQAVVHISSEQNLNNWIQPSGGSYFIRYIKFPSCRGPICIDTLVKLQATGNRLYVRTDTLCHVHIEWTTKVMCITFAMEASNRRHKQWNRRYPLYMHARPSSASFLAEISVSSPRKLIIFII